MIPACRALPSKEMSSTPKKSGKIVTMSMRMCELRSGVGVVARSILRRQLFEKPGRRRHGDDPGHDVDRGHDRLDEWHHDLSVGGVDDEEVLCREVVDPGHGPNRC